MIAKPFATAFFLLVCLWLGSILITSEDKLRIERTCTPVSWIGKLTASVMSLASPDLEADTHRFFRKRNDNCQYIVWRQFYSEENTAREERIKELQEEIARREAEMGAAPSPIPKKGSKPAIETSP